MGKCFTAIEHCGVRILLNGTVTTVGLTNESNKYCRNGQLLSASPELTNSCLCFLSFLISGSIAFSKFAVQISGMEYVTSSLNLLRPKDASSPIPFVLNTFIQSMLKQNVFTTY